MTAYYLKAYVERIESRLEEDMELGADTTIIDEKGTITVHTTYYVDRAGEIEKIFEKSLFGGVTTEISVYYHGRSPILFSTKQWQGAELMVDFDYYYQTDNPVYFVKRQFDRGKPDADEILKWCYQLLKESKSNTLVKAEVEGPAPFSKPATAKKTTSKAKKSIIPFFKKKR